MKSKWIYLFYLDKRVIGCFTSADRCVALWKFIAFHHVIGTPSVVRVKPNWILNACDIRFEDISAIIKKSV